jgi:hypothetical protein
MCAVSAITDHYRDKWPLITMHPIENPHPVFIPLRAISEEEWLEYQELKRKMKEYDERTGQADCEKPEVAVWEAAIQQHLAGQQRNTVK